MHRARLSKAVLMLVWAGISLQPRPAAANGALIDFLYIDAGEGSASGGHAAIKFGAEVFHFQHVDPGLLRAYRIDFADFRFTYGYRENRAIEAHRVEVADAVFQDLRDAFNRRYLIQNQQFQALKNLNDDLELLSDLRKANLNPAPPAVDLPGLGYFLGEYQAAAGVPSATAAATDDSEPSARLKTAIAAQYGKDFLRRKRLETWRRFQALKPEPPDPADGLSAEHFETPPISFAQRYRNLLLNLAALDVLDAETAPRPETLQTAESPEFRLQRRAIGKLAEFRQTQFRDLVSLLGGQRYDWGYPLLVGMARLHALDRSMASGRLTVLERCLNGGEDDKPQLAGKDDMPAVSRYAEQSLAAANQAFSGQEPLDEQTYAAIELAASRLVKIQTLPADNDAIVLPNLSNTPALTARAALVRLPMPPDELEAGAARMTTAIDEYRDKLRSLYPYRLLSRNCVTEIFQVIGGELKRRLAQPVSDGEPAAESPERLSQLWLGGYIPGQTWRIAPFAAFDAVGEHYRLHSSYRLPPYREREISARRHSASALPADLPESNILTSSIYRWHGEDAAFLFFTQDAVWPRPLLARQSGRRTGANPLRPGGPALGRGGKFARGRKRHGGQHPGTVFFEHPQGYFRGCCRA